MSEAVTVFLAAEDLVKWCAPSRWAAPPWLMAAAGMRPGNGAGPARAAWPGQHGPAQRSMVGERAAEMVGVISTWA